MLVIRLQRTGRKGHAMFRLVVQDSRRTPTSGKVVARLGSYDPHQKKLQFDSKKTQFYLDHGAQPSNRITILLKKEDEIKLPKWINLIAQKKRQVRNADKRKSTRPPETKEPEVKVEAKETETKEEIKQESIEQPQEEVVKTEEKVEPKEVQETKNTQESKITQEKSDEQKKDIKEEKVDKSSK
ncbi:MAG TPA: 30S ribosomal protein S16 [Patescibacteria group bacterium]|nr:30S ribosomal protein S16 [Patescibacteria group bacterium]